MPTPWRFFVCDPTTATLEEREESQVRVRLDDRILLLLLRSQATRSLHHICGRYEESLRWTFVPALVGITSGGLAIVISLHR